MWRAKIVEIFMVEPYLLPWSPEASSFRRDPELLDERPPFLGAVPHQRAQRLRRLPFARENFPSESGETGSHGRIGQRFHGRRIKLGDDVLRRALGREKPVPSGVDNRSESHLGKGRDIG